MARILVVDDDVIIREAVGRLLSRAGHEVDEAVNGKEAMSALDAHSYQVVVTDINMPEMDGIEVIAALRRARAGIPVVAMSGGGLMPKDLLLANADLMGAVEVIMKPFEANQMVGAVERALEASGDDSD